MGKSDDTKARDGRGSDVFNDRLLGRREFFALSGGFGLAALLAGCGGDEKSEGTTSTTSSTASATTTGSPELSGTVNFLAWPGHGDKSLIGPFEKATGVKVRVKEYANGD